MLDGSVQSGGTEVRLKLAENGRTEYWHRKTHIREGRE